MRFAFRVLFSVFALMWNYLVAFALTSVCRSHVISKSSLSLFVGGAWSDPPTHPLTSRCLLLLRAEEVYEGASGGRDPLRVLLPRPLALRRGRGRLASRRWVPGALGGGGLFQSGLSLRSFLQSTCGWRTTTWSSSTKRRRPTCFSTATGLRRAWVGPLLESLWASFGCLCWFFPSFWHGLFFFLSSMEVFVCFFLDVILGDVFVDPCPLASSSPNGGTPSSNAFQVGALPSLCLIRSSQHGPVGILFFLLLL